jgi:TetR/AcrR family transcriptional regulator, lmrAB and yxaGH operons repressor
MSLSESPPSPRPDTRDRLIAAMSHALQRRGYHGVGLNELLVEAGAPKGVLYHHFPGGKAALAVAAIEASVQRICARLDALLATGVPLEQGLRTWLAGAEQLLEKTGFANGCPLATVALESTPDDSEIRAALAAGFAEFRMRIAAALVRQGRPHAQAEAVAALIVSAYEGGLMQARVSQSVEPMHQVGVALEWLFAGLNASTPPQEYADAQ